MNAASTSEPAPFSTVAIVGVGLIGGSIAAALKKRKLCRSVIGVGRSAARLQAAQSAGLIDVGETDLAAVAKSAELIIFCTPVDRIVDGVREAAAHCRPGTLITDAGSIKVAICRELETGLPDGVCFIGSHPLAGSEKNGFEHADADLFEGRVCVVTNGQSGKRKAESGGYYSTPNPLPLTPHSSHQRLTAFWQSLGMTVITTAPDEHDRLLAVTSHVPHVVAPALASLLTEESLPFAASGFRDTTRIAGSDPALWSAILLDNAEHILTGLEAFSESLREFREALVTGDAARLQNLLQTAKRNRESLD